MSSNGIVHEETLQSINSIASDVEAKLTMTFTTEDERWTAVVAATNEAVEAANRFIKRRCREEGVPEEFAPSVRALVLVHRDELKTAGRTR